MSMYDGIGGLLLGATQFAGGAAERLREYDAEDQKRQDRLDEIRQKQTDELLKTKHKERYKKYSETKDEVTAIESAGGITTLRGQWLASGIKDYDDYIKILKSDPDTFYSMPELGEEPTLKYVDVYRTPVVQRRGTGAGQLFESLTGIEREAPAPEKTPEELVTEAYRDVPSKHKVKDLTEEEKRMIISNRSQVKLEDDSTGAKKDRYWRDYHTKGVREVLGINNLTVAEFDTYIGMLPSPGKALDLTDIGMANMLKEAKDYVVHSRKHRLSPTTDVSKEAATITSATSATSSVISGLKEELTKVTQWLHDNPYASVQDRRAAQKRKETLQEQVDEEENRIQDAAIREEQRSTLTKPQALKLQGELQVYDHSLSMFSRVYDLMESKPKLFGVQGSIVNLGQHITGTLSDVKTTFGQMTSMGDPEFSDNYWWDLINDPDTGEVDALEIGLAYAYARTLKPASAGKLNNEDREYAREQVKLTGLTNISRIKSKLKVAENAIKTRRSYITSELTALSPQSVSTPKKPTMRYDADARKLIPIN